MKLKKQLKEKMKLEKDYREPIKWFVNVQFSNQSEKEKKRITDYMILIAEGIFDVAKTQYESILNDASKGYVKIEEIPNYEDIFGSIKDMIKSNEESIKYNQKEVVAKKQKLMKEKDYKRIQEIESDLWWDKHRIENMEKEIRFLQDMQGKIIRESKWKFNKRE